MSTIKQLQVQKLIAGIILATGLLLMAGKIHFDGEPGLIPMVLVLLGTAWLFIARSRSRSRRR